MQPFSSPIRRRVRRTALWLAVLTAALFVAADQVVHRWLLADGFFRGRRVVPFDPPLFTAEQQASLELLASSAPGEVRPGAEIGFDALLGWDARGADFGPLGERSYSAPPRAGDALRVFLIGCSFTYGSEVEADATWAARLAAARTDLDLLNLGVPGYGLDQAMLRYERALGAAQRPPDEVWVGLMPTALLRLFSRYRPAEHHWSALVAFKPRFRFGAAGLELLPLPRESGAASAALILDQRAFLDALGKDDLWIARWPSAYAPAGSHPTHHSGLLRLASTWLENRGRQVCAWLEEPDAELVRLTAAILARVDSHGPRLRVLVLPSERDLRATPVPWAVLVRTLEARGIEVLDLGPCVRAAPATWLPMGHYDAAQNEAIAAWLAERVDHDTLTSARSPESRER